MRPRGVRSDATHRSRALLIVAAAVATSAAAIVLWMPAATSRHTTGHEHAAGRFSSSRRTGWSAPATLAACSQVTAPKVVFPQDTPFRRTGAGAIVFAGAPSCSPGPGAVLAAIGPGDIPGPVHRAQTASGRAVTVAGPLTAAATNHGQIVLIGARPRAKRASVSTTLSEGRATGPFDAPQPLPGAVTPLGLATAYLGDVAIASRQDRRGGGVQIRLQRYFQSSFAPLVALGGSGGAQRALAVALDYRSDALAAWWQRGWLYARERLANGTIAPLQRFARTGPHVELATLLSDDGRAIVTWMDRQAHTAGLYLDISAPGVQLGRGHLIERLRWSSSTPPPDVSLRLVRLSTEGVLMAWTGTDAGHFVVRAAGIDLAGVRTTRTVSAPAEEALLGDLATGPRGDAVAVWIRSRSRPAGRHGAPPAIMAARGVPSSRGVSRFGTPERVAATVRDDNVTVAIDPDTDRGVASWREPDGRIRYAVREAPAP